MLKPLIVASTRPECIKTAPIMRELESRGIEYVLAMTGQHDPIEMMRILKALGVTRDTPALRPHAPLPLGASLPQFVEFIRVKIESFAPTHVIVQGDTTSAFAGALAGFYAKVPVVHVEAGLRTYAENPWPEEMHRRAIATMATLHCAPTAQAVHNLKEERVQGTIVKTGNTGIDALLMPATEKGETPIRCDILVTMHRRENWQHVKRVFAACEQLANRFKVVWIAHPNPNVRSELPSVAELVNVIQPLGYTGMCGQMTCSRIILTDSGGIQEEAPSLGKPVLVLREETERPEAVECGAAKLVGTDPERIIAEATRLLTDPEAYRAMQVKENPFGDGHAAERVVEAMLAL